jgi:cytochrome bd-type quinol oxidase subunit 1
VSFPLLGNSLIIGIVSLLHIALAGLAVGFMILAPIAEAMGRSRPFYTDLAHTMTRFTLVTYTASIVLAVIMIEFFIGLYPLTNSWLFNRFRVSILVASAAFLLQLFLLYPYYHYWDSLRARGIGLHLAMGSAAAGLMLVWVAVLDGVGSYMLTPGSADGGMFNPTWMPLVIHRFVGNLIIAGYAMAGYAAWRLGRIGQREEEPYYRHMFQLGMLTGIVFLLLQPVAGLVYAVSIEEAAPEAYAQLMRGRYQGLVYLQFSLIGLLFVGSHRVLKPARQELRSVWIERGLVLSVLLMVAFAGQPDLRRVWTFLAVALLAWSLRLGNVPLATASPSRRDPAILTVRGLAVALAGVALLTYLTMGTIRETARRPDTVRGLISLEDEPRMPPTKDVSRATRTDAP